jgi:hypothetical protein
LKVQLLPVLKNFFRSDPAKSVLDHAWSELQKAWVESPALHISGMNALNFEEWELYHPFFTDAYALPVLYLE